LASSELLPQIIGSNSSPAPAAPCAAQSYHHETPGADAVAASADEGAVLVAIPRLQAVTPPASTPAPASRDPDAVEAADRDVLDAVPWPELPLPDGLEPDVLDAETPLDPSPLDRALDVDAPLDPWGVPSPFDPCDPHAASAAIAAAPPSARVNRGATRGPPA
jgi:hypothetical protein